MKATVSSQTPVTAPIASGMFLIIGYRDVMFQLEMAHRWGRHTAYHTSTITR